MLRAMTTTDENIAYCMAEVRKHDRERYFISLFAPEAYRAALWALYAFNQEVAKTKAVVSEDMLGEIRLQWWRETIEMISQGTPREHPVANAMFNQITDFDLVRPYLDEIIDTWSDDFGAGVRQVTVKGIEIHAEGTGGALNAATLLVLDPFASDENIASVRTVGKLWSLMGVLRGIPDEMNRADSPWHSLPSNKETADQAVETIKKLLSLVENSLKESVAGPEAKGKKTALKQALSLSALVKLELKAAQQAGDDFTKLGKFQPGDMRKLLALMKYHLFR